VYEEEVAPEITDPFCLHTYVNPDPVFAFSTTDCPVQNVVAPAAVSVAVGEVFNVVEIVFEVEVHPKAVTTTA
jgi:hypothetical protein